MALELQDIRKLLALRAQHPAGSAALILGDCHFHFNRGSLAALGGFQAVAPEAPATLSEVAAALGFARMDTVDLFGNPTIRLDLQASDLPDDLLGRFDWVIDAGTVYCCFNVPRVLANVLKLLKPSGCVYHHAALAGYLGRGYYALSPMFFSDFYSQNGFDIVEMCTRVKPRGDDPSSLVRRALRRLGGQRLREMFDWEPIGRSDFFVSAADAHQLQFSDTYHAPEPDVLPNNSLIMCFATRQLAQPFVDPIPSFFERTGIGER